MLTNPTKLVAGTHAWVAIEGHPLSSVATSIRPVNSNISSSTVQKDVKPSRTDTAWVKLGIIDTARIRPGTIQPLIVHASSPGHLVVDDIMPIGQERVFSIHCKEVQGLTIQLAMATARIASNTTQFNPDESLSAVKAWMKFQAFDNKDMLVLTIDQWALVSIPEDIEMGNKALTEVTYDFACIRAALNTGA